MMATLTVVVETYTRRSWATVSPPLFSSMFFFKKQAACVITKDLATLLIRFKHYKVTDKFLIFYAGDIRRSFEEEPASFKKLLLAVDSTFSITIV